MAAPSPLAGLLDRAGRVFSLAGQLARAFTDEYDRQGSGLRTVDPTAWGRQQPAFNVFCNALLELRDEMQNPPDGFAPVAEVLMEAARVAKQIRDVMQTTDGETWQSFLDFRFHFNSIVAKGSEAIRAATKARRLDDPFAFVEQPAARRATGIDTTPTVPKPPAGDIEEAARAIPGILANIPPKHDGTIELVAAHLAKRLQDAKHSLAAAHWSIHEAVQAGRLRAGLVEVELPSVGVPSGSWGGPAHHWHGGGRGTKAIPKGKPAPFDCFKVAATESLWEWWRSLDAADFDADETPTDTRTEGSERVPVIPTADAPAAGTKRSTERGEGRAKLIAAMTRHHQYADGGCLRLDPIGNNELAKAAGVSPSTASAFFNNEFRGHTKYKALCRDAGRLAAALKLLNNEFSPHNLYGRRPADEGDEGNLK